MEIFNKIIFNFSQSTLLKVVIKENKKPNTSLFKKESWVMLVIWRMLCLKEKLKSRFSGEIQEGR